MKGMSSSEERLCLGLLQKCPGVIALVQHYLESHFDEDMTKDSLTMPKPLLAAITMVALVGLEALEASTEHQNKGQR